MLTYLIRRQGVGLRQRLEKQIQDECDYWEHVLGHVIAVICTLAERWLAFRGKEERFGSCFEERKKDLDHGKIGIFGGCLSS